MENKNLTNGREYCKIRSVDLLRYASEEEFKRNPNFSRYNNFLEINVNKKKFFSQFNTYYVPEYMLFEIKKDAFVEALTGIELGEGVYFDKSYTDEFGNWSEILPVTDVFDNYTFLKFYNGFSLEQLEIVKQKYIAFNEEGKKNDNNFNEKIKQLVKHY